MTLILLVDDEPLITDSISYSLRREGYEVKTAMDGAQALQAIQEADPDLIVLDLMLPDISGLEVCRRLRAHSSTPVIMLTARGEEIDRVLGLEVGADDYLAKPFSFRELLARIRSILRRVELDRQASQLQPVTLRQLSLDPTARRVFKGDQELQLSAREFDLLALLMKNAGRALSSRRAAFESMGRRVDWRSSHVGCPRALAAHEGRGGPRHATIHPDCSRLWLSLCGAGGTLLNLRPPERSR